jgi:formiminoglutamate deiminase
MNVPNRPREEVWIADFAWTGGEHLDENVAIGCQDGLITSITAVETSPAGATRLHGVVLPGLVNAHSHAFHRLLRGSTHRRGGDFWLWREAMYEIAAWLDPPSYERLATAVFVEMAMAGITTVGEFHYLHHQPRGVPYSDPNEMAHALVRAARTAGINIGLLDAGYFTAGFDERQLSPVQERFADVSPEAWLDRVAELRAHYEGDQDVEVGIAPHSVRAVPESGLATAAMRRGDSVVHIHLSEQLAENQACLQATGATPTGLLHAAGLLDGHTTLVHATHVTSDDIDEIAGSGPTVCYCPTTERDLADGLGPAADLATSGVPVCAGSDSHAVIDMFEEARGIEMHARLATGRRGVFAPHDLVASITTTGAASLGFPGKGLRVGSTADFVAVDVDSPRLAGIEAGTALDSVVFSATSADITDVVVGGRQIVAGRHHPSWVESRRALHELGPGLVGDAHL